MPFYPDVTDKIQGIFRQKNLRVWKADDLPPHILRDGSPSSWWTENSEAPAVLLVAPRSEEEVAETVRTAGQLGIGVLVRGGGSGLGGVLPYSSDTPYIVMDLKGVFGLVRVNEKCSLATFRAGTLGIEAERLMKARGRTLGNLPMSLAFSTLGGWAATDATGHFSTYYGRMSDLVTSVRLVDGKGDIREISQTDGDFHLVVGSEGILGVITSVEMVTFPLEEFRFCAFSVPDMSEGVKILRYLSDIVPTPVLLRLHDPLDAMISGILDGFQPSSGIVSDLLSGLTGFRNTVMPLMLKGGRVLTSWAEDLLTGGNISPVVLLGYTAGDVLPDRARTALKEHGAVYLGSGPVVRWLEGRHATAYGIPRYSRANIITDTAEFSVPWRFVYRVYEEIKDVLASRALALGHISHPDVSGASVYFTFAMKTPLRDEYDLLWSDMVRTASRYGASVSHHHGMGRLRRKFVYQEHGQGVLCMKEAKKRFDPLGIMNPGVVL